MLYMFEETRFGPPRSRHRGAATVCWFRRKTCESLSQENAVTLGERNPWAREERTRGFGAKLAFHVSARGESVHAPRETPPSPSPFWASARLPTEQRAERQP